MGQIGFQRGQGLGLLNTTAEKVSGLIGNGYVVEDGVQTGTLYALNNTSDAEALSITQANDIANHMLVWYHIDEFFRFNPGVKLYLWLEAAGVSMTNMCDIANAKLTKMLQMAGGAIYRVGVFKNADPGADTLLDGFDEDVLNAIPKAQAQRDLQVTLNRPIHIYLEGRHLNGAVGSVANLRGLAAPGVSVCIAQDLDVAALDAKFSAHAAVGTLVGVKASQPVNVNVGWVAKNNIQNTQGRATQGAFNIPIFVNPGLSSNLPLSHYNDNPVNGDFVTLGGTVETPGDGCILPLTYQGTDGVYFNDDHTCTAITDDFYCAANNETWNKAYRIIYIAQTPLVNSPVLVNPVDGTISPSVAQNFESVADDALRDNMQNQGEISGRLVITDKNQDVNETSKVVTTFEIVPVGTAREVTGTITLVTQVSQAA
jgi:hypothetical protein